MANRADPELLASLAIDEIIVRLLRGPMGARIAQIGQVESSLQKMARAVSWLRANYAQAVDIEDLANLVNAGTHARRNRLDPRRERAIRKPLLPVEIDWLRWQLDGDARAGRTFTREDCRLCYAPGWTVHRKGI